MDSPSEMCVCLVKIISTSTKTCVHFKWIFTYSTKAFLFRRAKEIQARRKRCGMAAVAAPKICREKERKEREGRKKGKEEEEKREEKKERKGEESKRLRKMYAYGCKTLP